MQAILRHVRFDGKFFVRVCVFVGVCECEEGFIRVPIGTEYLGSEGQGGGEDRMLHVQSHCEIIINLEVSFLFFSPSF